MTLYEILVPAAMLFAAAVGLVALLRRRRLWLTLNPYDLVRSPICPVCDARMGWSLTCRGCGRTWRSVQDLHRDIHAKTRRYAAQIRREEGGRTRRAGRGARRGKR